MKTNIAIELNDEQRLDLAQKYNDTKNKKLLTRSELNDIVQIAIETPKLKEGQTLKVDVKFVDEGLRVDCYPVDKSEES